MLQKPDTLDLMVRDLTDSGTIQEAAPQGELGAGVGISERELVLTAATLDLMIREAALEFMKAET